MNRRPWVIGAAIALAVLLVAGVAFVVRQTVYAPKKITAIFPTATAIYPGDEVRVAGVKVGKIDAIDPTGTQTKMTLSVDPDVPMPADAKAVIVAPNLISARYVQLTPAYRNGDGPTMADGAVIGIDRTAIPVEWDEVKTQLTRLATDLGPENGVDGTSVSRFIDSAANALGRQRPEVARHVGAAVRRRSHPRRRQRGHRQHHQEPAGLRHGAEGQQHPDRAVPESAGDADQRARRQPI